MLSGFMRQDSGNNRVRFLSIATPLLQAARHFARLASFERIDHL
jgi:hypothetical protein